MVKDTIKVYNYDNQLQTRLKELASAKHMTKKERELVTKYSNFLMAENMSKGRIVKNIYFAIMLSRDFGMKYDKITRNHIEGVVGQVNQSDKYSEWSKHDIKAFIKKYLKYRLGKNYDPRNWDWIRTRVKREKVKMPAEGDILSVEEVERIISTSRSVRDKALISCLYESACRPSEILTLKIKDVKFDKYGCIINLQQSKTMQRPVRLVNSSAYLGAWINIHPNRKELDSPLWAVKNRQGHIGLATLQKSLKHNAKNAGVKKRMYPYLLRHSRITHMLKNPKYPHSVIKRIVGWTDDSQQISTYLHMSNGTVDNLVLEANGIMKDGKEEVTELNKPLVCSRCEFQNPYDAKVCQRCFHVFDAVFQSEIDTKLKVIGSLVDNPEVIKLMTASADEVEAWVKHKKIDKIMKAKR